MNARSAWTVVDDATHLAALPVCLRLRGRHADAVRRWTEGTLGWQPVESAVSDLVPPRVELTDTAGLRHVQQAARHHQPPPVVLLVDDTLEVDDVVQAAAHAPAAVLTWPSGRDRLAGVVAEVIGRAREHPRLGEELRVGGAAGGVGTTTVGLALAGLRAWSGARTLVMVRTSLPGPREVSPDAIADPDLWARATPAAGVPAVRAVRLLGDGDPVSTTDPRIDAAVVDLGVNHDVDVLVCRPDAAGLHALSSTTAAAVAVVGSGPVPLGGLRRAAAGRRVACLPWSARVERAGHRGRVPAGLPGVWLRCLRPLLEPHG